MIKPLLLSAAIPVLVLSFTGCASNKSVYPKKYQATAPSHQRAKSPATGSEYVRQTPRTVAATSPKPSTSATAQPVPASSQNPLWAESERIWEKGYTRNWLISSVYKGFYGNVIRYASGPGEKAYAICDAKWHLAGMMTAMHANYCPRQVDDDYLLRMVGKMNGIEGMCVMFNWARWIADTTNRKNPSLTREFQEPNDDARLFHERHGCDSKESRQFLSHVQDFFAAAEPGVAGLEPKPVAGQVPLYSQREEYFKATLWAGERDAVFGRLKQLETENPRLLHCEYGPLKSDGTGFVAYYFWRERLPKSFDPSLKGTNPIHSLPTSAATVCPSSLSGGRAR